MQEFPKCLYLGGDVEAEYRLAWNIDEESNIRAEGFSSAGEKEGAPDKPRRGRPPKIKE